VLKLGQFKAQARGMETLANVMANLATWWIEFRYLWINRRMLISFPSGIVSISSFGDVAS
jgi:hypothetical protein